MTTLRTRQDGDSSTRFTLELGRALGHAGAGTEQLEETMTAIATHIGLEDPQVFVRPTAITIASGPLGNQRVTSLRVSPGTVDLGRITQLTKIAVDVRRDAVSVVAAIERVRAIELNPPSYASPLRLAAYTVSSASIAVILGARTADVVAAAGIGLVTGAVATFATKANAHPFVAPTAAAIAAFLATAVAGWRGGISPGLVTLAGVVAFLPGVALTVGLRELSTGQLVSGVGNLAVAGTTLLGLIFGVAVGTGVGEHWFGHAASRDPKPNVTWLVAAAAAILAGLALTVENQAQLRDAGWMASASLVAVVGSRALTHLVGSPGGSFLAALTVGIGGNLFARLTARPSLVFVAPGLVMLVPGSAGFRSLAALLDAHVNRAIETGFDMFIVAIAIAYGLLLSNLILRPQPFR